MFRKLIVLLMSTVFSLVLLEGSLRLVDLISAPHTSQNAIDLQEQLVRSQQARPEDARQRFGLYGLVEASPHEDIVYRLKPNLFGTFRDQPIETNRYGHRQRTTPALPKPDGVFRIVGLGDSNMFGWGVPQGASYLERLETNLRAGIGEDGPQVEIVNCAVPGYNTVMQTATYQHVCRAFDPDLIVLHWVGNDFGFPHFLRAAESKGEASPLGAAASAGPSAEPSAEPSLLERSALVRRVQAMFGTSSPAGGDASDELDPEALPELLPHRGGVPKAARRAARQEARRMVGAEAGVAALERLGELAAEDDAPVVFLILGVGSPARTMVSSTAERLGFEIVNAAQTFASGLTVAGVPGTARDFEERYQIPNDGHPNEEAHRLYARVLEPVVRRHLDRHSAQGDGGAYTD